jgi:hypothetical protein
MILASCGGKAVETVATDSVSVDSAEVVVDTTVVEDPQVIGGGAEVVETKDVKGEPIK